MSEEDLDDDIGLKPGVIVESSKAKYTIIKLLGEGGFGAVYKVHETNNKEKCYAMKVERKIETRRHSKLKMEIMILKVVSAERKQSHFTTIADRGKKEKEGFFFLVMELVGKSLADLKGARPDKVFSPPTGLSVAQQCLEACEDLHKYGFIHRDLKPANYACGIKDKHIIYILDFGIARKILNEKNELRAPRESVRFKGTVKFASISCHKNVELGWKDDCESWFYLLLDLVVASGLPWRRLSDKHEVQKVKEECRTSKRESMIGSLKCKEELGKIMDYIDSLKYPDRVDYHYVYKLLEEGAIVCGGSISAPYDWE
ncbi:unnamed protein product [Caenorhabditis auriculariae]|uniref:Protein kinase domain-containing protein n=1 Tax=Caenorhabditis auriculariae TaxID=2777116 RepID=A0A8S1GWH1_9PELO|nr:unnamed protein product [Caenorhabditis auriculariae]